MSKFIKITPFYPNNKKEVYININNISYIEKERNGSGTYIEMVDRNQYYHIEESVQEFLTRIQWEVVT